MSELGVDLTMEQWVLLWRIYERGPCGQRALTDPLFDDRANITRMVERLETSGWVQRAVDPADGRRKLVSLTKAGHDRFVGLFDEVAKARGVLFGGFSESELTTVRRFLDHLDAAL